jgi:hypothetical protein
MKKLMFINKIRKKKLYQFFIKYSKEKTVLFIVGSQRSGTNMLLNIFREDYYTNVYGEFSKLSAMDKGKIRLNPYNLVKKEINKDKAPFTILKPLVESQNILKLLDFFENSYALWIYRDYKDVASSDIKKFGLMNGINSLRPSILREPKNWRSEGVSEEERNLIKKYFSESMNPYDAAVLFWYLRNNLFYRLNLDENSKVILCKYEYLIANPKAVITKIYKTCNQKFPGERILNEIHLKSFGKGKSIDVSPEIESIANNLLQKFDASFYNKNPEYI